MHMLVESYPRPTIFAVQTGLPDQEHGRAGQRAYLQSDRARPSRICIFAAESRKLGEGGMCCPRACMCV